MATSSTVPAFTAALVSALAAALPTVQVTDYWPGPATESSGIFLEGIEQGVDQAAEQATIKTGRKYRHERYRLVLVMQDFTTAQSPSTLNAAFVRVWSWQAVLDGLLADNQTLGTAVMQSVARNSGSKAVLSSKGWGERLLAVVEVEARLT